MSVPNDLLMSVKGKPGVGKVIAMADDGNLHWARIECDCGGLISLVVDEHSGHMKRNISESLYAKLVEDDRSANRKSGAKR